MIEKENIIYLNAIVRVNEDGSKDERKFAAILNDLGIEARKNDPYFNIKSDHIESLIDITAIEKVDFS